MSKEKMLNQKDINSLCDDIKIYHMELLDLIEEIEKPPHNRATIGELMEDFKTGANDIYEKHLKLYPHQINP